MIPFNKSLLIVVSALLLSQAAFSQVKKQYQDKVFNQTTIVVKEDNATDTDILTEFDLDEIGMDQVIRITTEKDRPAPVEATPRPVLVAEAPRQVIKQSTQPAPTVAEQPQAEQPKAEQPIAQQVQTTTSRAVETPVQAVQVVDNVGNKQTAARPAVRQSRSSSGSYRSSAKRKRVKKTRRVKLKKRKRFKKRNKYKCYKF
ncbi:MAG: hypothetical protein AAGG75_26700 [Bacteroidota bacterium]